MPLAVMLSSCGGDSRREAVGLGRVLIDGRAEFSAATRNEADLVDATRAWTHGVLSRGGGRGEQLQQHSKTALQLASSAAIISRRLGVLRAAVHDMELKEEATKEIRTKLLTEIATRQTALQELRSAFQDSSDRFRQLGRILWYQGNEYPAEVKRLKSMVDAYQPPKDAVGEALHSLSKELGIGETELATELAAQ
jgi:hypothetical protein